MITTRLQRVIYEVTENSAQNLATARRSHRSSLDAVLEFIAAAGSTLAPLANPIGRQHRIGLERFVPVILGEKDFADGADALSRRAWLKESQRTSKFPVIFVLNNRAQNGSGVAAGRLSVDTRIAPQIRGGCVPCLHCSHSFIMSRRSR